MSDLLIENKVDSVLELDLLSIWAYGIDTDEIPRYF